MGFSHEEHCFFRLIRCIFYKVYKCLHVFAEPFRYDQNPYLNNVSKSNHFGTSIIYYFEI